MRTYTFRSRWTRVKKFVQNELKWLFWSLPTGWLSSRCTQHLCTHVWLLAQLVIAVASSKIQNHREWIRGSTFEFPHMSSQNGECFDRRSSTVPWLVLPCTGRVWAYPRTRKTRCEPNALSLDLELVWSHERVAWYLFFLLCSVSSAIFENPAHDPENRRETRKMRP